jgi:hypothetical protein
MRLGEKRLDIPWRYAAGFNVSDGLVNFLTDILLIESNLDNRFHYINLLRLWIVNLDWRPAARYEGGAHFRSYWRQAKAHNAILSEWLSPAISPVASLDPRLVDHPPSPT